MVHGEIIHDHQHSAPTNATAIHDHHHSSTRATPKATDQHSTTVATPVLGCEKLDVGLYFDRICLFRILLIQSIR